MSQRIVVISGGLGGIGKASVDLFVKNNDFVICLDIVSKDHDDVKSLLKQFDNHVEYYTVNCADENQVVQVFAQIINKYKKIDVLFNVVGGSGRNFGDGPIHECTIEGFNKTLELNLMTQFVLSKTAVQHMLNQGSGCIINLSSVLGLVGGNDLFATHAYAATKGAIIGFSRAMATYYAPYKIRVNVIAPGLIETPMSQRAQNSDIVMDYMKEKQPIYAHKNKLGNPYAVASAALYLASEHADFVTGVVLPIDGGWTAQ